jgi:single stranded DNA-binding protein (ssb)
MFNGTITGHLGRDPDLRYLDNGQQVANFTVAVRQSKRNGQDLPARWVKVAVWGKAAEYVGNYVKKGDGVMCIGRVEAPELFTRRDGTQGLAEVFTAENIEKWTDGGQRQQGQALRKLPLRKLPLPWPPLLRRLRRRCPCSSRLSQFLRPLLRSRRSTSSLPRRQHHKAPPGTPIPRSDSSPPGARSAMGGPLFQR